MSLEKIFNKLRSMSGGKLAQSQVDAMNIILDSVKESTVLEMLGEKSNVQSPVNDVKSPNTKQTELDWIKEAKKHLGHKEIGVTNTSPLIEEWQKYLLNSNHIPDYLYKTPWCFTGETQILTEDGWQRFDELSANRVYQVDEEGGLSLTTYTPIVKPYVGKALTVNKRDIEITCDENHLWWGYNGKITPKNLGLYKLSDLKKEGLSIPRTFSTNKDFDISDRDLRLLAAFISDGSLHKVSNKVDADKNIVFEVSKQRKIDYLRSLSPNHEYTQKKVYGVRTKTPLTVFTFKKPVNFDNYFSDYKELSVDFINKFSQRQAQEFIKTYNVFDGNGKESSCMLYTSRESGIRMLTHLMVLAGYHHSVNTKKGGELSKKDFFYISYTPHKGCKIIKDNHIVSSDFNGMMYCVSVPNKRIVVRNKKGALVTGNCGTFVANALKRNMINYPKHWYRALDYCNYGVKLSKPAYGCVAIKTRDGGGHVCFVVGRDNKTGKLVCLGGNQSNSVSYALYSDSEFKEFRWYGKTNSPAKERYILPNITGVTATKVTEA